jgi:hypothetical protein
MTETEPGAPDSNRVFDELMAKVTASAGAFGHREHVHLTWLAVRRVGMPAAIALVSKGIQRTARYERAPQKYHVTVSRAWVELVAHHAAEHDQPDFAAFAERESRAARQAPAHTLLPLRDPGQHSGPHQLGRARPRPVPLDGPQPCRHAAVMNERSYGQSKTANALFAVEATTRWASQPPGDARCHGSWFASPSSSRSDIGTGRCAPAAAAVCIVFDHPTE